MMNEPAQEYVVELTQILKITLFFSYSMEFTFVPIISFCEFDIFGRYIDSDIIAIRQIGDEEAGSTAKIQDAGLGRRPADLTY